MLFYRHMNGKRIKEWVNMKITVFEKDVKSEFISAKEMSETATLNFPISERVPGVEGAAFDLKKWYDAWTRQDQLPTHLTVEAVDEFQATIPWSQLDQAAMLYEKSGRPLEKGFPIRLYVPDGSSSCLNVKSIVAIRFLHNQELNEEAVFGFKNQVSADELVRKSR
jgi:hypothetical protein